MSESVNNKREFLLAGQPEVVKLSPELYEQKLVQLSQGRTVTELKQGQVVKIDMRQPKQLVKNEGSHTCLLSFYKYGLKMWIGHSAPGEIASMAIQTQNEINKLATKGETYLTLLGNSPLPENVVEGLGMDFDGYQVQRQSQKDITIQGVDKKIPVIIKDLTSDDPKVATHSFIDIDTKTIYYMTQEI